jgi:hypothetical protein
LNILNAQNNTQTLPAFLVLASVACQWVREGSAHARNHDLSAAAEIFANGTYFPNKLRIVCRFLFHGLPLSFTGLPHPSTRPHLKLDVYTAAQSEM